MKKDFIFLACLVVLGSVFIYFTYPRIDTNDAIDAIVGEAANQNFDTMVCVAQGIRHRGTLHGVYGLHAKHNGSESADTYEAAEQAWDDSTHVKDMIHGAKNWGTANELPSLGVVRAKCGDLYFY